MARAVAAVRAVIEAHPVLLGGLEFSQDEFAQRMRHTAESVVEVDGAGRGVDRADSGRGARSARRAERMQGADVEHDPWFHAEVAPTPDGAVVGVVAHHLAWDGWSARVFRRQLLQAVKGRRIEVPDYARWIAQEPDLISARRDVDLDYWLPAIQEEFTASDGAGFRNGLAPAYETRRVLSPAEGDRLQVAAPLLLPAVAQCLRAALAAIGVHHQVSSVFNGRTVRQFRDTIGCFVNPLVLPLASVPPDTSPSALLKASQEVLRALRHGVVPFDQIVAAADAHRRAQDLLGQLVLVDRVSGDHQADLPGLTAYGDTVTVLDHPLLVRLVFTAHGAVLTVTGRAAEWSATRVQELCSDLHGRLTAL